MLEGGGDRPLGVVLEWDGVTEEGEDPIPQVLVQGPAVAEDDVGHCGEVLVEGVDQLLGLHALGHLGEPTNVRHQDREIAPGRSEGHRRPFGEDGVGNLGRDVAAQLFAAAQLDELLLDGLLQVLVERGQLVVEGGEPGAGPVEVGGEPAELVAVGHVDLLVEVAVGDPGQRHIDLADGTDQRPGEDRPEGEGSQQADRGEDGDDDGEQLAVVAELVQLRRHPLGGGIDEGC